MKKAYLALPSSPGEGEKRPLSAQVCHAVPCPPHEMTLNYSKETLSMVLSTKPSPRTEGLYASGSQGFPEHSPLPPWAALGGKSPCARGPWRFS